MEGITSFDGALSERRNYRLWQPRQQRSFLAKINRRRCTNVWLSGQTHNLAFDSHGLLLATGGREVVTIWNFADGGPEGTRPTELDMHSLPITCLSFSPTQPLLASGARDGSVMVWSVDESGEGIPRAGILLAERITSIAWSPNGNMLSATSGAGQITTWQLET